MHCPEMQAFPTGHVVPHLPQLDTSVNRLVQRPGLPHWVVPVGHWQNDPMHAPPAGQRSPHWLQLSGSDVRSTHLLPHRVPVVQTHWPPTHAEVLLHLVPHAPQLAASVCVFVHDAPQSVSPAPHEQ
jgi:hypothetical protein